MAWKRHEQVPVSVRGKRATVTVDATNQIVGRLATQIARLLMGKDQPSYTPHLDTGAIVRVVHADKLVYSGKKMEQKVLFRSSNRPSGIKRIPVAKRQAEKPGDILVHAVRYMLPKNITQKERLKRLIIA